MQAIQAKEYGSPLVFQLNEVTRPAPKPNEILIRIHAATVTAADIMMRKGKPYIGRLYLGLMKPTRVIPGFDFAGEIVELGEGVTSFRTGDKVFGGTTTLGCYAEYVCVNAGDVLTTMPENLSYEEAAPVTGSAITVLNFLKGLANIKEDHKVLINGASGALGTYAIQYARHVGAEVTGVCSAGNVALVKSLGADNVIDYTKNDFANNGKLYDIIFDTVAKRSYAECKNSLTKSGIYMSTGVSLALLLQVIRTSLSGTKQARFSATGMLPVKARLSYLKELKELMQTGKIKTVIDNMYPLSQMEAAHRYVEKGHKKGNTIIVIP